MRKIITILLILSISLPSCSNDEIEPGISREKLIGTWIYQSSDGGNSDPYTEVTFDNLDKWAEYRSETAGDTIRIGGGIWNLQDSILNVTYVGTFNLDRTIKIEELDSKKLVWKINGVKTTLFAK